MATLASCSSSYATAQDLINRFDLRPIEQLLSDSGTPLALGSIPAFVQSMLQEASGILEAAATAGQRYIVGASPAPTPAAPTLSTSVGGTAATAGTYLAAATLVNSVGESLPSPQASITAVTPNYIITVASPAVNLNAQGWNAYVSQTGGSTLTLQNTTLLPFGTNLVISVPPTSTGAAPPTTTPTPQNDLLQIVQSGSNTGEMLKGIVCALVYVMIWERRPEWLGGDPEKAGFRVKMAMDTLDKLQNGYWVFGTIEAMKAGEMNSSVETEQIIIQENRPTHVARRLFGPRVADIVGMRPPPHPYP